MTTMSLRGIEEPPTPGRVATRSLLNLLGVPIAAKSSATRCKLRGCPFKHK